MHEASLYVQLLTAIDFNEVRIIIITFFIHNLVWNMYMYLELYFLYLKPATFCCVSSNLVMLIGRTSRI